jgi:hypothetical protein
LATGAEGRGGAAGGAAGAVGFVAAGGGAAGAGLPGFFAVNTTAQCGHFTALPMSFSGRRSGFLQASQARLTNPGAVAGAGVGGGEAGLAAGVRGGAAGTDVATAAGRGAGGACAVKDFAHWGHFTALPSSASGIVRGRLQC